MADYNHPEPTFFAGDETLWTRNMGPCNSLATFCLNSKQQSLTHLAGGGLLDEQVVPFAHKLAAELDEDYVLIWISGTDSLFQKSFRDTLFDFSTGIMDEMIKLSKRPQLGEDQDFEQNTDGYMKKETEKDPVIVPNTPN